MFTSSAAKTTSNIYGSVLIGELDHGKITSWRLQSFLSYLLALPCVAIARGRLYVLGGLDSGSNPLSYVSSATIEADGSLGKVEHHTHLPYVRAGARSRGRGDAMTLPGGTLIRGKYRIERLLGEGGIWASSTSRPNSISTAPSRSS